MNRKQKLKRRRTFEMLDRAKGYDMDPLKPDRWSIKVTFFKLIRF